MYKLLIFTLLMTQAAMLAVEPTRFDFKVLGTNKTSTMEKEMNEAAQAGYVFQSVMGGETAFGGKEVIVIMGRTAAAGAHPKSYRLFAANKTSTLEKEMQLAAETGYEYKGQTVFESAFGGREVSVIMERDKNAGSRPSSYRLLATSKTSTMEKELAEAGAQGYAVVGMTVSKTAFGGNEVVCILKREASE
jgi:hypothetical protein